MQINTIKIFYFCTHKWVLQQKEDSYLIAQIKEGIFWSTYPKQSAGIKSECYIVIRGQHSVYVLDD